MEKLRKLTTADIRRAFSLGPNLVEQFRDRWNAELGEYFIVPGRNQLKVWLKMCGWDWEILAASIADLESRVASHPPLSTYEDPYEYALRYYSASLIRRTRQKHGRVRPPRVFREAA